MKVLVVGAGPAGATTALLLARYGVDVTLVEREMSFERVFRGEGLMPLGIDALFQMGLQETLESVPYRLVRSWDIWIDGEEAFVVPEPVEKLGGAPCAWSPSRPFWSGWSRRQLGIRP